LSCIFFIFFFISSITQSFLLFFIRHPPASPAQVGAFLLFLAFVVLAYAAAFYILFRRDLAVKGGSGAAGFDTFPHAALTVWAAAAEGLDYAEL